MLLEIHQVRFVFNLFMQDGTWGSVKGSFNIIRDFSDVCYYSYFSIMDDLRRHGPPEAEYYEIRYVFSLVSSHSCVNFS